MSSERLTHLDDEGRPRMVDVGDKQVSHRTAVAEGTIRMSPATMSAVRDGHTAKGNVLQVAQLAGIMGAKRTPELIPLCHPLLLESIEVDLDVDDEIPGIRARATVRVQGRTGVEMEALTAVSCALLTVYDMCKAIDRDMRIESITLLEKQGGRSGTWRAQR
jgi:cyclic pyranopterin phosphate synthase